MDMKNFETVFRGENGRAQKAPFREFRGVVLAVVLALMAGTRVSAQNDVLLTQQWLSRINQNPAATGNSDNIDIFVLARRQWTGFDNAPLTQTLNIHNYFQRIRSGLGLTATHDETGIGNRLINAKLAYAYHVNLGEKWLLSLGLSAGILQNTFDPSGHFYIDTADPLLATLEKKSQLDPDFDFGIELSSQRFLFGASVTHIARLPDAATTLKLSQQYFGYVSYKQPVGESFDLIAGVRGTNFDEAYFVDFSLTGMLLKKYWIGAMFRPDNAVAGMIGMQIGFVRLGYSYDYSMGSAASLAKNSHEIMLSFKIGKPKRVINTKSPRFIEE
jgi:type IX secretion system PorP/SprF family membrane protein